MWPYRNGGGLILYVHEGIPCKPWKIPLFDISIKIIGLEFHQIGTYKPLAFNDQKLNNELFP